MMTHVGSLPGLGLGRLLPRYVHVYVSTYPCIYMFLHVYTCTYIYTNIHICTHVHIHICVYIHIYIRNIHIYTNTWRSLCARMCI